MRVRIADGRIASLIGFRYSEEHLKLLVRIREEAPFVPLLALVGGKIANVRACGLALGNDELRQLNVGTNGTDVDQ